MTRRIGLMSTAVAGHSLLCAIFLLIGSVTQGCTTREPTQTTRAVESGTRPDSVASTVGTNPEAESSPRDESETSAIHPSPTPASSAGDRDHDSGPGMGNANPSPDDAALPRALTCLMESYPQAIVGVRRTDSDELFVQMSTGEEHLWDDGVDDKDFQTLIERPDLEDTFRYHYPARADSGPPARNEDPGRIRHEAFLRSLYGDSAAEVSSSFETVRWTPSGRNLSFNSNEDAAAALVRVGEELMTALTTDELKYVSTTAGTFNWRTIAGTDRLSAHSFAIAIDINTEFADYWRWSRDRENPVWRNRIPLKIVEVFERHGFIWGGKWYHYDTMHFEYRPELLHEQCRERRDE